MTLLVPFDGSALSKTALARASEFGELMDQEVIALVVIPPSQAYAREKGWIDPGEPYDDDRIERGLRTEAEAVAPGATVHLARTESADERASVTTDVVREIRRAASKFDAEILFVGSENAGKVTTPVTSVGSPVSDDPRYDVHIVRHADDEWR